MTSNLTPRLNRIERLVRRALKSLRTCLWEDRECYWPQEGYQNSLPERNLTIHFSHILLANRWVVFAEASFPSQTNRRIDLIGVKNGVLIAAECKQLDMADRAQDFAKDIADIRNFTLTPAWDTHEWQAPKISLRYGVLLAITWSAEVKDWWVEKQQGDYPNNHTGQGWAKLGKQLHLLKRNSKKSIFGEFWLTCSEQEKPDFWVLYSVFELSD